VPTRKHTESTPMVKRAFPVPRPSGTKLLPLTEVANFEKKIPIEWINDSHNGVKQEFIDYVLPLIQGEPKLTKEDSLPRFAKLKKVLAK
jgi:hypothetical protein